MVSWAVPGMGDEEHVAKRPVPGKGAYVCGLGAGKLPDQAQTLLEARIHGEQANIP